MAKVSRQVHEILDPKDVQKYMEFKMIGKGMAWIVLGLGILTIAGRSMALPVTPASNTTDTTPQITQSAASTTLGQPSNVKTDLQFNFSRLRYNLAITWDTPENGLTPDSYVVRRDGVVVGTTRGLELIDKRDGLATDKVHIYSVESIDSNGESSQPVIVNVKTRCLWAFCSLE